MPHLPQRIQLKRTKGWRMPANTVKVDRSSRWGNPFVIGRVSPGEELLGTGTPENLCHIPIRDRAHAVALFRTWLSSPGTLAALWRDSMETLRGKNLACWCPLDEPCHADTLLAIANHLCRTASPDFQAPAMAQAPPYQETLRTPETKRRCSICE